MMREVNIIMPVKDSIGITEQAIRAITEGGYTLTVYNDYSTAENTDRLDFLSKQYGFKLVNLSDLTIHPSPNYLLVLQTAQKQTINECKDLLIIESDVTVKADTISFMQAEAAKYENAGIVAAVTEDENGEINFPYEYAIRLQKKYGNCTVITKKRLSFCCTLLTLPFLKTYDFHSLDPEKNWYDVTISHKSSELGFNNLLMLGNRVLHRPHSSRPWKKLKYTNPLLYYWRKLTQHKDKI